MDFSDESKSITKLSVTKFSDEFQSVTKFSEEFQSVTKFHNLKKLVTD